MDANRFEIFGARLREIGKNRSKSETNIDFEIGKIPPIPEGIAVME